MSKWDEKAKNYSRYSEGDDRFEAKILQTLQDLHVEVQNKTAIDIGCGTGVYTLRVAQIALHVDAIDSSSQMLDALKEDATRLKLKNITTVHSSWDEFSLPKELYDVALCTMSPAVNNDENFKKMTTCAKTKVYLGWAGKRSSAILEKLFTVHDATYHHPNGAKKLSNWLDSQKIAYKILPFNEKRKTKKEFSKAFESFIWHLEVRGIIPNKSKIEKVLKEFCDKDGFVTEAMTNKMSLIIW